MKKLTKCLFGVLLSACLFAGLKLATPAQTVKAAGYAFTNMYQSYAYDTSATVKWDAIQGSKISYKYTVYDEDLTTPVGTRNKETYDNTAYISSLASGKTYYLQVSVYDNKVLKGTSPKFAFITVPASMSNQVYSVSDIQSGQATISWAAQAGANTYKIKYYEAGNSSHAQEIPVGNVTSYTLNLTPGTQYYVYVYPGRISPSGFSEYTSSHYDRVSSGKCKSSLRYYVYSAPVNVGSIDTRFYTSTGKLYVGMTQRNDTADGYEWQLLNKKGKKLASTTVTDNNYGDKYWKTKYAKKNQVYQLKVRAYNIDDNGTKHYSTWSKSKWICKEPTTTVKSGKKKINVSWKKITDADRYVVYAVKGNVRDISKYKKVATVKANKKSYAITKIGKKKLVKGKTYSVIVTAQKKVGKKYVTISDNQHYDYGKVK